jgi:glycosyltransferase involved in cell wall biosynthesis
MGTLRVLIIIDSFSFGGAEKLLAVLSRAAPSAGLDLEVASLAPFSLDRTGMLPVLEEAGLPFSFLDIPRLAYPAAVPRIARAVKESGCDVVHAHLGYSAILAPVAARLAGRRCVATLHHMPEDLPLRERLKERMAVAASGRLGTLVFVSDASRREFARRYRERPQSWQVAYNGVDLTSFSPGRDTLPTELRIEPDAPVVTVVAALRAPKGHQIAIRAWTDVIASVPEAHLLIVGDGPERQALEQAAAEGGVGHRVLFLGARGDVPRLLRASALVALPSLTEALPTSLIEAAACGRAAVGTRVGGVPEVIEHGRTGLLIPPGDPAAFADAVVTLLTDTERRHAMEREARLLAEERFDMHVWARRLRALYERMPGPSRSSPPLRPA